MQLQHSKYILLICSLAITLYQGETIVICGNGLAEMLTRICDKGYNYRLKRTGITLPDYNAINTENNIDNDNPLDNYGAYSSIDYERQPLLYAMLGESARNQMLSTRRRRFNIVEECCDKPCTTAELKEYCL